MALFKGECDHKPMVSGIRTLLNPHERHQYTPPDWADWDCYGLLDYCTESHVCNRKFASDSASALSAMVFHSTFREFSCDDLQDITKNYILNTLIVYPASWNLQMISPQAQQYWVCYHVG